MPPAPPPPHPTYMGAVYLGGGFPSGAGQQPGGGPGGRAGGGCPRRRVQQIH